jgi:hypothetical protein
MVAYRDEESRLQLAKERGIIVDPIDEWLLRDYSWHVHDRGYVKTNVWMGERFKQVTLHHCLLGCPIWEGEEIDHKDRNPSNNRRDNLRWVSRTTNRLNSPDIDRATHISLFPSGRYIVRITREGECRYLGSYETLDEAVATRDEWLANNGG